MKVLYANHTGRVSGAERSLIGLLAGVRDEVSPVVACPPGRLADTVRGLGIEVRPLPETDGSLRLHPWYSTRALAQVGRSALRLRNLARQSRSQLIHANSIRAGLAAVLAAPCGGPPVIVHLRDCLPSSRVANLIRRFLIAGATCMIANSDYTATNFARGNSRNNVVTVHNSVDLDLFSPSRYGRDEARAGLGLETAAPVLGVIGQLAPWKGHDDAIRCFATLRSRWPNACLLLVGDPVFTSRATRYDNRAYSESLPRLARSLNLNGSVRFLGEREDLPAILRALDLVLVPSWEEPFGRTVVEAMAMEVPVVATSVGGPAEVITDGVDGVLLPPRQPESWASVIDGLLSRSTYRAELGLRARRTVTRRFGINDHARKIVAIYREVLAGRDD